MKQVLIFIFFLSTLSISAQSVQSVITSTDRLPDEVKGYLKNLSVYQIESFQKSGKIKSDEVLEKYDLKIENNFLKGSIKSNQDLVIVNIKMIWHCDHNPQHIATSKKELKQNTREHDCKNWSYD